MEKQKLSGKTILKLAGALLALAYLGFCLYAGITGKFPGMHQEKHVMRFGNNLLVSGGMSAVIISVLCFNSAINDVNLQKGRKKTSSPSFFIMLLLISFPLLLESYLDIGWDWNCFLCGYYGVTVWNCMDSSDSESMDCPSALTRENHERQTAGADHRMDSFLSVEKTSDFRVMGIWCCTVFCVDLGSSNR